MALEKIPLATIRHALAFVAVFRTIFSTWASICILKQVNASVQSHETVPEVNRDD
jgi:hypothetical protein